MGIRDCGVLKNRRQGIAQLATVHRIGVNHHVGAIKQPNRDQPRLQHFWHLTDGGKGPHCALAHKNRMAGTVGCVTGLMLKIEQKNRLTDLCIRQTDTAGRPRFRVYRHAAHVPRSQRRIVEREHLTVIVVEQNLDLVRRLAHHVRFIENGVIKSGVAVGEINKNPALIGHYLSV